MFRLAEPARLCGFLVIAAVSISASPIAPFALDFSLLGGPSALYGTTIASGLNFPYGINTLPNGSLVYGQSLPTTNVGLYYGNGPATTGSVWVQAKQLNGTFASPQKLVDGLAGVVTDVRTFSDGTILVSSGAGGLNTRQLSFYDSTGQSKGSLTFNYPGAWEHSTGMSAIRQNSDGTATIVFNIGSRGDDYKTTDQVTLSGLGLSPATLNADSLYSLTVNTSGNSVQAAGVPVQIATGFRNAYGLSFDRSGNLYAADNGIDGVYITDQTGADALFRITAQQFGSTVVDGGFPNSYVSFATGQYVSSSPSAAMPLVAYRPAADSQGNLQKSEGVSGLAYLSPGTFGTGAQGGILATFHGIFDGGGAGNNHDALELYDLASGKLFPLFDAGIAGIGHIDSVSVSGNAIYLSDFSQNGQVNSLSGVGQGAVYEFDYPASIPEPGTWLAALTGLSVFLLMRHRAVTPRDAFQSL